MFCERTKQTTEHFENSFTVTGGNLPQAAGVDVIAEAGVGRAGVMLSVAPLSPADEFTPLPVAVNSILSAKQGRRKYHSPAQQLLLTTPLPCLPKL
jgi:hypothetical protein